VEPPRARGRLAPAPADPEPGFGEEPLDPPSEAAPGPTIFTWK